MIRDHHKTIQRAPWESIESQHAGFIFRVLGAIAPWIAYFSRFSLSVRACLSACVRACPGSTFGIFFASNNGGTVEIFVSK